ncbi:MAG: NAD(P)/FAD-dependent oxidoreductase [Candidatus Binatia bacterium]
MRGGALDDNRSSWLHEQPPYVAGPPLAGDTTADVAIVGGGLTGVSAAWHLSRRFPDRRIVLLEAKGLANGASGRNGGQLLTGINGVDSEAPGLARRIYDVTRSGIDLVEQWIDSLAIDAGLARRGCLEVYTSARGAAHAQARVERLNALGIPLHWLPATATGVHGAHGAVLDPAAGRVNAAALLRGMRPALLAQGVAVYEHTPVAAIREGATIHLTTPRATVRAGALVLATNAYTPALGYFRGGLVPLHSHVVATPPLAEQRWAELGWTQHDGFSDDLDRIAYGCRSAAGRLVFGGGDNAAYAYLYGGRAVFAQPPERAGPAFAAVERRLRGYFPALAGTPIEHRWTGTIGLTYDRVCSMGVRGAHRNVYYALGYSGHGLALAALAGRVLCDLYSGDHDPWRDLPFYQKPLPRLPPEPLRWLGYHAYTRLTGRSPRRR